MKKVKRKIASVVVAAISFQLLFGFGAIPMKEAVAVADSSTIFDVTYKVNASNPSSNGASENCTKILTTYSLKDSMFLPNLTGYKMYLDIWNPSDVNSKFRVQVSENALTNFPFSGEVDLTPYIVKNSTPTNEIGIYSLKQNVTYNYQSYLSNDQGIRVGNCDGPVQTLTIQPSVTVTPTSTPTPTPVVVEETNPIKPSTPSVDFNDINGHWAEDSIINLASKGFVTGTGNSNFSPNRSITRAEIVVIISKAIGLEPDESPILSFSDKKSIPSWAAGYVSAAYANDIISGYEEDGMLKFKPNNNVSREEMAVLLVKAMNLGTGKSSVLSFTDNTNIQSWSKPSVARTVELGIVKGYANTSGKTFSFKPANTVTRAEAVTMIVKALEEKE